MWFEFFHALGSAYQAYRAFQDAGGWFLQMDGQAIQNYMESSMIENGRL